jgi:plasmid segregation protein ParM
MKIQEVLIMLIAIDHGNYAIKTPNTAFISGLAEHSVKPPMADDILEYDGKLWTLTGQRLSYMRDKTQDDRYFILSLFVVARELELAGVQSPFEQVDLAVGLPPEHYGVLRTKFAQYFKRTGSVKFAYKDKPVSIMINNVFVYPQAYAAIIPQSSQLLHMLRVFIIDIGGYTTDVLLLRSGKPDLQFCRSLESGVITMNNEIVRKVNALHDMRVEDDHINAVLQGQDTILPEDVKETIRSTAKAHAKDILDKLRELQVDLRSNPAIFIGGGSILFKEFLETSLLVKSASFILSPNANAVGYELLARKQLSLRSAR